MWSVLHPKFCVGCTDTGCPNLIGVIIIDRFDNYSIFCNSIHSNVSCIELNLTQGLVKLVTIHANFRFEMEGQPMCGFVCICVFVVPLSSFLLNQSHVSTQRGQVVYCPLPLKSTCSCAAGQFDLLKQKNKITFYGEKTWHLTNTLYEHQLLGANLKMYPDVKTWVDTTRLPVLATGFLS